MAEEFKQLLNLLNSEDNSVRQSAEDKYASLGKFKNFLNDGLGIPGPEPRKPTRIFLNFEKTRLKNYSSLSQLQPITVFQMAFEHWLLCFFVGHLPVNGKNRGKFYPMI